MEARQVWLEALNCFKQTPYFLAWIRYNLATLSQNEHDEGTERHLLAALELVRLPKVEMLGAMIWSGLGKFRIELGEWNRADFAFVKALAYSTDSYDKEIAYRGCIRSQYLSSRLNEALETLETALHEPDLERHMLYVAQAKVYLKLGNANRAKTALEKAGKPQHELEEWPWRIASAEVARQEGHPEEALELLEGLPTHTLHSREEVRQFPQLFALLEAAGRPVPEPLEYVQGTTVQVEAKGVLRVGVNGRKLDIAPTGRVGELLVFLLEQGGAASLEGIEEALYLGLPYAKRRRQAIWNLVDKLREVLGWERSVISLRGAYQLDPQANWVYDIAQARAERRFRGEFLMGIYSPWAIEVGQELQMLGARDDLEG